MKFLQNNKTFLTLLLFLIGYFGHKFFISKNSVNNNTESNNTESNNTEIKPKSELDLTTKSFDITKINNINLTTVEPLVLINYSNNFIILHKGYKLPILECHKLYKKELLKKVNYQRPPFIQDPNFKQWTYSTSTYSGTGFDRGHLFSAESASTNPSSYMECFYTTNIFPQNAQLNRGKWKSLEDFCRKEAMNQDSVIEMNLLYKFEQNVKFKVPRYCTKILIYPDSSFKFWSFDNLKNEQVNFTIDSIQSIWNQEKRLKFKKKEIKK